MIDYEKRLFDLENNVSKVKLFCHKCGLIKPHKTYLKEATCKLHIRGTFYKVKGEAKFCSKCNQRISSPEHDDIMLIKAYELAGVKVRVHNVEDFNSSQWEVIGNIHDKEIK